MEQFVCQEAQTAPCLFAVSPGVQRGQAEPQASHWERQAGFGLGGGLCPQFLGVLAAGSSVPAPVHASWHPWAVPAAAAAEPPAGWEQLKGGRAGSPPQPLPLGSYSPTVLPAGCPVELGPQLGLWDELGKEEEVKFPPTSFSSNHIPWPPQLVAQWPQ